MLPKFCTLYQCHGIYHLVWPINFTFMPFQADYKALYDRGYSVYL